MRKITEQRGLGTTLLVSVLLVVFSSRLDANQLEVPSFELPEVGESDSPEISEPWFELGAPDTRFTSSVEARTGAQSFKSFGPFDFIGNGTGIGQFVEAEADTRYFAQVFAKQQTDDALAGENFGIFKLEFLDENLQLVGTEDQPPGTPLLGYNLFESDPINAESPKDEWVPLSAGGLAPEGTVFAQVILIQVQVGDDGEFAGGALYWDDALLDLGFNCDLNSDGACDAADIDVMTQQVLDGTSTAEDRLALIEQPFDDGFHTYVGDSTLDGLFDEQDFVAAFVEGQYLTGQRAGWSAGDWDGNLLFNEQDFVFSFITGDYLRPPRGAVATVPEPAGVLLFLIGGVTLIRQRLGGAAG